MTKLELMIELDSKGAVKGVQTLDSAINKLDGATQKTTGSGKGLMGSIVGQVTAANLATKAISFLGNELGSAVDEALEAEKVQNNLNSALRASGESAQVMGNLLDDFAGNMQAATGASDEEVKSLAALAYNMGINRDAIQEVTKGAIGLSTLFGGSLQSNLEAVAKAYQGNWRQIDAMIPEIKELKSESDKLAMLQEKMAQGFQASTDAMQGATGAMKTAKNQWNDFKEAVGGGLLALFSGLKKVSDEITGQAYLARKLRDEYNQYQAKIEELKKTHLTYAEVIADEGQKEAEWAKLEGELKKQKEEVAKAQKEATEYIRDEAIKAQEAYNQQLERMKAAMPAVNSGVMERRDTQIELNHAIGLGLDQQGEYNNIQYDFQGIVADSGKETKKWTLDWKDANQVIEFAKNLMREVAEGLEALGVDLGRNGEAWLGAAEGAATFTQGLITHNPLTIISGAVTFLTGAIQALAGDGIGEAIKRENEWMALNENLEEQLRDLAKEVGTVHEATSIMLDDIIESTDITIENFDQYAQRIQQILSNLDRGELSLAETTHEIGEAFDALIDKAEDLGTEGSKSLIDLFGDLKNRGIEVAEINEYIAEKLGLAADAYADLLDIMEDNKDAAEVWGDLNVGVLNDILAYRKKVAANQDLENSIDAATDALYNLSAAQKLSEEQFDSFGEGAAKAYEKLLGKGYSGDEALQSMKEMMQRLQYLKEQFGFSLDPELQKLLDQAIKKGIVIENAETDTDLFKKQVDYQQRMADALAGDIPKILQEIAANTKGVISADSGFYSPRLSGDTTIRAHEGESVRIVPGQSAGNISNSSTAVNVVMNGVITPENVIWAFLQGWRTNRHGIRSAVQGRA